MSQEIEISSKEQLMAQRINHLQRLCEVQAFEIVRLGQESSKYLNGWMSESERAKKLQDGIKQLESELLKAKQHQRDERRRELLRKAGG